MVTSYQRLRESRWACPFRSHGRPARKGLDEACAELCKACRHLPPVTRMSRKDSHRDVTQYELNCTDEQGVLARPRGGGGGGGGRGKEKEGVSKAVGFKSREPPLSCSTGGESE